jgi:hypothetical protein
VVTVDHKIFESFAALDSDDEEDTQKPWVQQFMINFAAASGLTETKSPPGPAIKVQEVNEASIFSQSMMLSKRRIAQMNQTTPPRLSIDHDHPLWLKQKRYLVSPKVFPSN